MSAIVTITMSPAVDIAAATEKVTPIVKLRCTDARRDAGGGGINVARVITRLGGRCHAIYPAGGSSGQLLHRLLDEEGIVSLPVDATDDTRENFTVFERASGEQYRFVLPGAHLSETDWQAVLTDLSELGEEISYVVVSGSMPSGVPADFCARVARIADERGARMVLDTSGPALAGALDEGVYLVKPNLRELRDLTGQPLTARAEWEAAAMAIVEAGQAEVVTLTLGDEGAFLASRELRLRAAGIPVTVSSAVGAGDSFLAAMIWRLSEGSDLHEAFRHGVAAGTAALLTPGTELCRKPDVERIDQEVKLSEA